MIRGGDVVYAGWLERKGTSMLTPWTTRWVVLTDNSVKHYKDDQAGTSAKGELKLDETTRIILAESEGYNNYRFAIATSSDILEFGVTDLDLRNMWIQKFVYVAEKKSALGAFVMRVTGDTEYRNAIKWERTVVAHSIDESSGLTPTNRKRVVTDASVENSCGKGKADYASFLPFDAWLTAFEPEVMQAREQAQRAEEARKKSGADAGKATAVEASSMDKLRDYLIESVVTNITATSTTRFCNLLLEGVVQLIAASERQLARTYRKRIEAEAAQAAASNASQWVGNSSSQAITPPQSLPGSPKKTRSIEAIEQDIPLSVQEDLLCTLGSLRALALSYRFQDPSRDTQMSFTRRLAAHQLERSLSRVLKSLEELQGKEKEKLKHLVGETVHHTTTAIHTAATDVDHTVDVAVDGAVSTAEQAEALIERELKEEDNQPRTPTQQETRRASLRLLHAIMRPLLSREFLQLEAAPLMQEFMVKNKDSVKQLEGLAAEVTQTFGGMMQTFIDKKIGDMEQLVVDQVDVFMNVVSEYSDPEVIDSNSYKHTAEAAARDSLQHQQATVIAGVAIPTTSKEVLQRIAVQKAVVDKKIAKIKTEGSVLWDGTDKSLVEMVLLEQTDSLWKQLQETVQMGVSYGLYALLDMAGGGLSASAIAAHQQQQQQGGETSHPAMAPATTTVPKPASTGYFF